MRPFRSTAVRTLTAGAAVAALALGAAACGGGSATPASPAGRLAAGTVTVGALSNGAAVPTDVTVSEVAAIRAELPASVAESGRLVIGVSALPAGIPPLVYVGTDQKTLTGSETDLGRLVAAVLGLRPDIRNSTWENLFVGIDSGRTDVGFSNITDTEERKKKYDFASYREDNVAFEVLRGSSWNFGGDYRNLAGQTVAVASGTNQEKILLAWQAKLRQEGKSLTVKYFPDPNSTYLALAAHKIDSTFAPNPTIAYHMAQDAGTTNPTRNAGAFSGAGQSLQGLIAATSKRGSGLAKPVADAVDYLIANGQYAKWLNAYHLSNEAVTASQVNPPGLPTANS